MIIVITGPTGVGKTKLSIELAKKYNAEIINADSMQIYKELNIGTAKIKEREKEGIIHHLLDIRSVNDEYSVYEYQKEGRAILNNLIKQNKNIIICGGTGLYIKALLYDYRFNEEKMLDFSNKTLEELQEEVLKINSNPNIDLNNRRRLERFLNKYQNNVEISYNKDKKLYDFKIIGLTKERSNLYDIINKRADIMINEGLIEEAKSLYDKNINTKAINTAIGYKELYLYFNNEISLNDAIELIKKKSRNYAKRQYTFFNNQFSDIKWFNTNYINFNSTIEEVLKYLEN